MLYSIWLIPGEPVYSEIQRIIRSLSSQYNTPYFDPHLTLLGGFEQEFEVIKKAVMAVGNQAKQLALSLGQVSFSTTYYQSVFIRVNSAARLMQLNLDLKKFLNQPNNFYMPHISFIYDELDMKTREKIAQKIKLENTEFAVKKIVVIPEKSADPKDWKPAFSFKI